MTRRRRNRPMSADDQIELMGCIMLGAVILGIIGGPLLYLFFH